jgi:hypothetical protein
MRYGLFDARGRDFPVINRFTTLWNRNIAPVLPAPRFDLPNPDARALRALSLLSVAHLLQDPRNAPLDRAGLSLVYDRSDARIYRNAGALPRALVVERHKVVASARQALEAVESPEFDGRAVAVTERPVAGVSTGPASARPRAAAAAAAASITSYSAERVDVRATASRPSLLVLTDSFFPGWKAEVDGKSTEIHRVNYLLRGVRVPAGTHKVVFRYEPASFRWGLAVSLASLLVILALAAAGFRSRRRPT